MSLIRSARTMAILVLCCASLLYSFLADCRAAEPPHPLSLPDPTNASQWRLYQYNKAKGRLAARPEFPGKVKDGNAAERQSLGIKIDWQGGGDFQFFTIEPTVPLVPLPFTATELRAWVHGSGSNHSIEIHLTDADGKEVKASLGSTGAPRWHQLTARIPADWKQPLTFRNLTFHNWEDRDSVTITVYVARLEAIGEKSITTALPLSPAPVKVQTVPAVVPVGVSRVVSDLNLPGEWRVPPRNQDGGSLSLTMAFPADVKTDLDTMRQSLQVGIHFPGSGAPNGFNVFQVEPIRSLPVPFQLLEVHLWLKGTGTRHNFDLLFTDADGKSVNLSPTPDRLDFVGWRQVSAKIPADWLQPLTFHGIAFYSWGIKEPANLAIGMSRLEFVIDPKHSVKREESTTNDSW